MRNLFLALGAAATALAATNTTVHGVTVGANGLPTFGPSTVFARDGDVIQFVFYPSVSRVSESGYYRPGISFPSLRLYRPFTVPDVDQIANIARHAQLQNHSVTQSSSTNPCTPLPGGFFSGFILTSNTTAATTFLVNVTGTDPLYYYSSQGTECQSGMVGVVNPYVYTYEIPRRHISILLSLDPGPLFSVSVPYSLRPVPCSPPFLRFLSLPSSP